MSAPTIFSTRLQALRKENGVTQEQLAGHLGVSPQAVSKWENGSYPDGDLLPKIADFFKVTIDYLYGRAERDLSVEQQIINDLQKQPRREDNSHEEYFDKVLEYIWAMQIAGWRDNRWYYPRSRPSSDAGHTASSLTDKMGFTFLRMNEDLQYYFITKTPPQGFAKRLGRPEALAPLFEFLGDIINLKVLMYMLSLNAGEVVRASTVAKRLNIPVGRAEKALGFLCRLGGECANAFHERSIMSDNREDGRDTFEKAYDVSVNINCIMVMLLAVADTVIEQPVSYNIQIGDTGDAWLNREQLEFLNRRDKPED